MLLQKEYNINQEKISEYKKLVDEVDFIDKKLSYSSHSNIKDFLYIVAPLLLLLLPGIFNNILLFKIGMFYWMFSLSAYMITTIYLEKNFLIDGKFNHSKKKNWLERKLIFFTNKREKKYKELLDKRENLLLKIKYLEIDFKALEMLFEEQKSKFDISSNESVEYVNAYNSYKNNLKNDNIVEALRSFTNYFENKNLSSKNLYSYI